MENPEKNETGQTARRHNLKTPQTISISESSRDEGITDYTLRIDPQGHYLDKNGEIKDIKEDKTGRIVRPVSQNTPRTHAFHPMNPLVQFGIHVIEGIPYEAIVNDLINNSRGKKYGVRIRGQRSDKNLDGKIFIPTEEEEPYNNQIRIDHAKIKYPQGIYQCIYDVTSEIRNYMGMWNKLSGCVKIENINGVEKYLIRSKTEIEYGKGGVMDNLVIEKPKTKEE